MGLLSFLLRKPSSSIDLAKDFGALKAQSYDATVAATPPILGAYPVAGNGTSLLERLQQTQPHVNNVVFDSSAPPPAVPRLRSDSVERPKTAPSKQGSAATSRAKTSKRQGPPYKLPPKIWSTELKPTLTPPTPAFSQDRTFSIGSSSSRGFVDLLDAQSAIKPSDFHSRVKAAGAKDYGEDVADRNLAENGLGLASAEADEFDFKNFSAIPNSIYDIAEDSQPRQPHKRHSIATGMRTESLDSRKHGTYLKRDSHHVPEQNAPSECALNTPMKSRRNSLHSYVALSSSTSMPRGFSKQRNFQESDIHKPSMMQHKANDAYETNSEITTEASSSPKPSRSLKRNRNFVKHHSTTVSRLSPHQRPNEFEQSTASWEEPHEPIKRASKRQTMHLVSSSAVARSNSRRHSLQSMQSPNRRDVVRDGSSRRLASMDVSKPMEGVRLRRNLGTPLDLRASPLSTSKQASYRGDTLSNHRDELNELVRRTRAQSIASISSKDVKPSDIEEMVPERNSSLRNYSLTSETATYSSLGSNPFRPQSRHTPNTSIDLTPTVPFFTFSNPSQNDLKSAVNSSPQKGPTTRSAVTSSSEKSISAIQEQEPQPDFDLDEYASSDDSFENPHKPRGENEKELLFVESVYGFNGSQLPGLPGLFGPAASRPTTSQSAQMRIKAFHSPSSSVYDESDEESHPDLTPYSSRLLDNGLLFKPRVFQEPSFSRPSSARSEESVQNETSDDEISFDIPRARTGAMRYNPTTHSRLRYETAGSAVGEEDGEVEDDAVDITTLMRLRKEIKAKRRESGKAVRRVQSVRRLHAVDPRSSGYMTDAEQS